MSDELSLSNLSYTNKDFTDIYTELLDLAKKVSYKWDPTVSNESDPGVLLLKLCAIIADKNNYNIDKNVLECFPLSVTQESNARKLFEQIGYTMKWYRGAETTISLRSIGDLYDSDSEVSYDIGRFVMVTDSSNGVVYTMTDDISIPANGKTVTSSAIQGIITDYSINGSSTITISSLDSNNRLYFTEKNVAENGIFIENADGTNGSEFFDGYYGGWKKVDNLSVEELGKNVYSFGVTSDGRTCYIEFPDDVATLFGQGIKIKYIVTDGADGGISSKIIEKFYNDVTITVGDSSVVLDSDKVQIMNAVSSDGGSDPETIDSAYRNYKKTVGTFKTLVTLRDYNNAINGTDYISNGFVCDRTNDIQCSYKVINNESGITQRVLNVDESDGSPMLDAFDLKIYALQYISSPSSDASKFNGTFKMLTNDEDDTDTSISNLILEISDSKSLQHDFGNLLRNKLCMIKNKYPINCKIIPQYKVTSAQASAIEENIKTALFEKLNSQKIDFGEEIVYDNIYDIIINADERIKAITLDSLDFTTYAVYFDGTSYNEVNINSMTECNCGYYNSTDDLFYTTPLFTAGTEIASAYWLQDSVYSTVGTEITTQYKTAYDMMPKPQWNSSTNHYYNSTDNKSWTMVLSTNVFSDLSDGVCYTVSNSGFVEDIRSEIQNDIYAKSVLNGNTQILEPDTEFDYRLSQNFIEPVITDVSKVTTNTEINLTGTGKATEEILENEHIFLYASNLKDVTSYSTYVKYQYVLTQTVTADSDYMLKDNESITFYWKDSDDEDSDYTYYRYGSGTIIKPSFSIIYGKSGGTYVAAACDLDEGKGTVPHQTVGGVDANTYISSNFDNASTAYTVLSSSKSITIREVNKATLNNNTNLCYWILNKETSNNRFVLFEANETVHVLQSYEFFIYRDSEREGVVILGSGTKISRSGTSLTQWSVPVIDYESIVEDATTALEDSWFTIPQGVSVVTTETQYKSIGSGYTFSMAACQWNTTTYSTEITDDLYDGTTSTESATPYSLKKKAIYGATCKNSKSGSAWIAENAEIDVTFDNSGVTVDSPKWSETEPYTLSDFTMSYQKINGSSESEVINSVVVGDDDGWNGKSILNLNVTSDDPIILNSRQSVEWEDKDGNTGTIAGMQSSDKYILSDYSYSLDGGSNVDVTRTGLSDDVEYMKMYVYESSISAITNVTYNSDGTIDIILDGQNDASYAWEQISKESDEELYDYVVNTFKWQEDATYNPSGILISGEGATPSTLGYKPTENSPHYYNPSYGSGVSKSWTSVHAASESQTTPSTTPTYGAMAYNSTSEIAWIADSVIEKTLKFNIPVGTYIVPASLISSIRYLSFSAIAYNGTTELNTYILRPIYDSSVYDIHENGVYYLKLDTDAIYSENTSATSLGIKIKAKLISGASKITIKNIYKYDKPTFTDENSGEEYYMDDEIFESILHTVFRLDTKKKYDYTYVVDENELIKYPLNALSMFDTNHILNKFMICQLDTGNISTFVTNKIK